VSIPEAASVGTDAASVPRVPSASQRLAIEGPPQPLLVLAGPGAGKTFCLIERIGFLIVATCGFLLASSKAEEYYYNSFFRLKLALFALVLYPFIWLLSLPFRLLGIAVGGILDLVRAIIMLPTRVLRGPHHA